MDDRQIREQLPKYLTDELVTEYGTETAENILGSFPEERIVSLRINTLKTTAENVKAYLDQAGILYETVPWYGDALVIVNAKEKDLEALALYEKGEIYLQSLSSMLPPLILNPQADYHILDMASAPGGKTTEIAALTGNKSRITACEQNAIRAEKLKYNIRKQGVTCAYVMVTDARQLDEWFSFDQILLDAPCSGSGTIEISRPRTFSSFSEKLVQKSVALQTVLLNKGLSLLKPGQELVYSTCSILKKENEEVIIKVLKNHQADVIPIAFPGMEHIPMLPSGLSGALSVSPNRYYEGFYVVKIRKR